MTVKDDLIAAKALIDTPEKWRQDSETLYSGCCAVIATNRVAGSMDEAKKRGLWLALYNELPKPFKERPAIRGDMDWSGVMVGDFNDADSTTHADIMALFDRAIAAAEAQP